MKKHHIAAILAAVVVVFVVVLCLPPGQKVSDRTVKGGIVSLAPNVTEIVFALGLQDRLLGVSTACNYPPAAKGIRKVGDLGVPNIELICALKPELVITTSLRDPEARKAIEGAGAKVHLMKQNSLGDVLDEIVKIGEAAGVPERARQYASELTGRIERATVAVPDSERPRVFIELSSNPLRTAGATSFVNELIRRAGGKNIAGDMADAWTLITPEAVLVRDPEIIIVAHPFEGDARAAVAGRIGWSNVAAVKSGIVTKDIDLDLILRPGPRLADGVEALAALFKQYREARKP